MRERARDVADPSAVLAAITARERPRLAGPVAIVLAHPDDETLACGALLSRLADLTLVHVTDGAPRDGRDARRHGFPGPAAYAAARRSELGAAMAVAGASNARLVALEMPDQEAALALADIARRLVGLLGEVELVLTHAVEGGHPDHDATAFAVRAAVALLRVQERAPTVVEMPLYRAGPDGGWLLRSFADRPAGVELRLTEAESAMKARMVAAHASQRETLAGFSLETELYRLASPCDVRVPPNGGAVLYERHPWGMTQPRFAELALAALHELGLPGSIA